MVLVYNVQQLIWSVEKSSGEVKTANVYLKKKSLREFLLRSLMLNMKCGIFAPIAAQSTAKKIKKNRLTLLGASMKKKIYNGKKNNNFLLNQLLVKTHL